VDASTGPRVGRLTDVLPTGMLSAMSTPGVQLDPFWVGRREHMFDTSCR
jgi:hypothetical protein